MGKTFQIDGDAVRQLADILNDSNLTEIEYEDKGARIRVTRSLSGVTAFASPAAGMGPAMMMAPSPQGAPFYPPMAEAPAAELPKTVSGTAATIIRSPMVGTAYLSPEPGAPTFVKVGDTVTVGQPLLIIEAMKVMNQIKSTAAGKVIAVHVQDGQPVEYDTELFSIA